MLDHAGAWRVYLGGRSIRALRGENAPVDDHFPEEWIASTVEAAGAGALPGAGLSRLREAPYYTLRDKIASAPGFWLGEEFVRQHGPDCGVLLKLLDAAERLNVQVHPSRDNARRFWRSPYGKLECWHFLDGRSINGQLPYFYGRMLTGRGFSRRFTVATSNGCWTVCTVFPPCRAKRFWWKVVFLMPLAPGAF